MADYIYNDFYTDPNGYGENQDAYYQAKQKRNNNLVVILVCAFFSVLILLTTIFGFILVGKVSSRTADTKNVDSLIFSSPTTQPSTPINPSATTPAGTTEDYKSYSEVIYAVKDSVVDIKSQFISGGTILSEGAGSGVIIGTYKINGNPAGYYIVTNAHVVESENGAIANKIAIRTSEGKEYPVTRVRGSDSQGDIAVLMVDTTDTLKGVSFGDSNYLTLGQEVIAIGNPLGELGGSCTNGIISALNREVEIDGQKFTLLQTNAAINQGNSGGGLFNMRGQLIGIINAKSMGSGIEGIGFAIPSNDAKKIVDYLIEGPYLGITVAGAVDMFDSPYVYVHDLDAGYNSNNLRKQDVILSMNGIDISTVEDVRKIMRDSKPGDTIETVIKRGNEFLTVTLTVYQKSL